LADWNASTGMLLMRLELSLLAEADLEAISDYIA
jgi:hypothetical protein